MSDGFKEFPKIPRLNREIVITEKIDGTNAAIVIERVYDPAGEQLPLVWSVRAQSRNRFLTVEDDQFGFAKWVEENRAALIYALGEGTHFGEWWGKGIQRNYGLDVKRFSLFNTTRWIVREEGKEDRLDASLAEIKANGVSIDVVPVLYRGPWTGNLGYKNDKGEWFKVSEVHDPVWPELEAAQMEVQTLADRIVEVFGGENMSEIVRAELLKVLPFNPRPRFAPNFILEWLKRNGSVAAPGFKHPEGIIVYHTAGDLMFKATVKKDEEWKGKK